MDDRNDDLRKTVEAHKAKKGKIINLADYANTTDTREMINRVKEDKSRNTKKRNLKNKRSKIRWKAGVAAAIMLISIATTAKSCNAEKENVEQTTSYSDITKDNKQNSGIVLEDEIDTVDEVEEDFVKKYLDLYNEEYGTNYKSAEMLVKSLKDGAVYKLDDGRIVTRGPKPYETEEKLKEIGNFEIINGHNKVVQVIADGKVLGTYDLSTGEFIYSGNQMEDLENEDFKEPTLEKLGINEGKLKKAAEVKAADKGGESPNSIGIRIEGYNGEGFER